MSSRFVKGESQRRRRAIEAGYKRAGETMQLHKMSCLCRRPTIETARMMFYSKSKKIGTTQAKQQKARLKEKKKSCTDHLSMSRWLHAPHPAPAALPLPLLPTALPLRPIHSAAQNCVPTAPPQVPSPTSTANKPLKKAPRNSNLNPWRVHASVGTSPANLLVRSRFSCQLSLSSHPKETTHAPLIFARFTSIRRHKLTLQLSKLPFNSRKTRPKLPNNGSSHPPFILVISASLPRRHTTRKQSS